MPGSNRFAGTGGFSSCRVCLLSKVINDGNPSRLSPVFEKNEAGAAGDYGLFIMGPHAQHFYDAGRFENLVNQAVLNIDPAGVGALKIADELFKRRWGLERIGGQNFQNRFCLRSQAGLSDPLGVLPRLRRKNEPPRPHQPGSFLHFSTGVFRPRRIDSRIPGMESR